MLVDGKYETKKETKWKYQIQGLRVIIKWMPLDADCKSESA